MNGPLDGVTLMRYAHIYRARESGGAEQYLRQLNTALLERNRMTIVQMHLVPGESNCAENERESIGRGSILWCPVRVYSVPRSLGSWGNRLRSLKQAAARTQPGDAHRDGAWGRALRRALSNRCGHLRYSSMVLSEHLAELLRAHEVNLLAMHWMSYDARLLLSRAASARVPYVFVHHFDNARLAMPDMREWVRQAAAVGGVSAKNVPEWLQSRFQNLSDAVDTDFFAAPAAGAVARPAGPVVLLPGRITEGKGHLDAVGCARRLQAQGLGFSLVFAGATDSVALGEQLKGEVEQAGLQDRVLFLGQLSAGQLRDWYAASDAVLLPSSSEGLGRVLLEAQAMEKPVIAYNTGGIPEALRDGETGFLVCRGDVPQLTDRLRELLLSRDLRLRLGQAGRRFVEECFSIPALVGRHERFMTAAIRPACQ